MLFLAHYCNNRISVNSCYIRTAQILYNMYNFCNSIVQTCFTNSLYNSNLVISSKIAYFRAKYRINFSTSTRSTIVSLGLLRSEDQQVSINNLLSMLFFPQEDLFARSNFLWTNLNHKFSLFIIIS